MAHRKCWKRAVLQEFRRAQSIVFSDLKGHYRIAWSGLKQHCSLEYSYCLTDYQTTNFGLVQIETVCRRQS